MNVISIIQMYLSIIYLFVYFFVVVSVVFFSTAANVASGTLLH